MPRVHLHLPNSLLHNLSPETNSFYGKLLHGFADFGVTLNIVQRRSVIDSPEYGTEDFHFVHQARISRPNVLNTGMAYLFPFWYADPKGIYSDSSIAQKTFNPHAVDGDVARQFHRQLKTRLINRRMSKYEQPEGVQKLPQGSIAIFLQGDSNPVRRAQYCTEIEMVRSILANAGSKHVLIKPHPRNNDTNTLAKIVQLAKQHANAQITNANIHDILTVAELSCSVSSGVSMESLLHNTPTILFGKTDFHHCAQTVENLAQVPVALSQARTTKYPYSKFLYWFLQENCINAGHKNFMPQVFAHMARGGYDITPLMG